MVARQRAAHQLLDAGSIFYDPFALKILGEDESSVLQFATAHPSASIGRLFTAARSRVAEDAIAAAIRSGLRQIVILGAGLDTFALRSPSIGVPEIRIFEVDHPATQALKQQRLAGAQIELPSTLTFVPVDFEQDSLQQKLVSAGLLEDAPVFFTWLGVVPYLTLPTVSHTLDDIASFANSEIVFDYLQPPEAFSDDLREIERARVEALKKIDENSVCRFEPPEMAVLLKRHGFTGIQDTGYSEIIALFGHAVQGLAPGHAGLHVVHARH